MHRALTVSFRNRLISQLDFDILRYRQVRCYLAEIRCHLVLGWPRSRVFHSLPELIGDLWAEEVVHTVSSLLELFGYIAIAASLSHMHCLHLTSSVASWLVVRIWCVHFNCLIQLEFARSAAKTLSKILMSDVSVNFISAWSTEWFGHLLQLYVRLRLGTREFCWIDNWHFRFYVPGSCLSIMIFVPTWTRADRFDIWVLLLFSERKLWFRFFTNILLSAKVKWDCGILSRWWSLEFTVKAIS